MLLSKVYRGKEEKHSSPKQKGSKNWRNYRGKNYEAYKQGVFKSAFEDLVRRANNEWNSEYGYSTPTRKAKVFIGKGKKYDYSDISRAYIDFKTGLELLSTDTTTAFSKFDEAIVTWDKIQKEVEVDNKKARITSNVAVAMSLNKLLALIHRGAYSEAEELLIRLEIYPEVKNAFKNKSERIHEFLTDEIKRNPKS